MGFVAGGLAFGKVSEFAKGEGVWLFQKILFSGQLTGSQFKYGLHQEPPFAVFGLGQGLLQFPHHVFPSLHVRVGGIHLCFPGKIKPVGGFDNHEHPRAEPVNLHGRDARIQD